MNRYEIYYKQVIWTDMKYTTNKLYEQIRNILQTSYMGRYEIYYKVLLVQCGSTKVLIHKIY